MRAEGKQGQMKRNHNPKCHGKVVKILDKLPKQVTMFLFVCLLVQDILDDLRVQIGILVKRLHWHDHVDQKPSNRLVEDQHEGVSLKRYYEF